MPTTRWNRRGTTLPELLIAVALIGVGIIASVGAFNLIQRSIQSSKANTLATNFAQQQMQVMMQKSYFEILVTTNPAYDADFSPSIPYDTGYFPPQTLVQGGIPMTCMTFVQVVQEVDGRIVPLGPDTPDTGMRQITMNVVWNTVGGKAFTTIRNVINNPNTVMSNVILKGTVRDAVTHAPIQSAVVDVAENVGWRDSTDSTGKYAINMSPGNFQLIGSALGYFTTNYTISVAPNSYPTQDLTLLAIATGTVSGTAWYNTHLLISQVVASTGSTNDIEYVELYNPTTAAMNMGVGDPSQALYWSNYHIFMWYYDQNSIGSYSWLTFISTSVPAGGYYLIANTTTVSVAGLTRAADAMYSGSAYSNNGSGGSNNFIAPNHMIQASNAGGISLYTINTPIWSLTDRVGWSNVSGGNAAPVTSTEGNGIASAQGLAPGEQFVRKTDTGTVNPAYGRAYDTDDNASNFVDNLTVSAVPNNSTVIESPIAGTPAYGASVSISDGLSSSVKTVQTGSPPYAQFVIPGVASGTWSVFIDSGPISAEIDNVAVAYNSTTWAPNASTAPPWPAPGDYATLITSNGVMGMISGQVTDSAGAVISPAIVVTAGGVNATVGPTGRYSIRLTTGIYDVTANPSLTNSSYQSLTQTSILVNAGDETANINFMLAQGGKISGWVTRDGTNPLPGVSVVAYDLNGVACDTEISGANGSFTLINLPVNGYTVQPVLDTKETSSPANYSASVVAGTTVSVGTFTVVGAMGSVTGAVTSSGQPISTGVLVVVSTSAIGNGGPPALSSTTLTGAAYYANSSQEDGTYTVQVRGSTTSVYNMIAYYYTLNNQIPVISSRTLSNVTVTAGQTTGGKNFSW